MYDVIVAGGSITGLLCAREIASQGNSVLVIEEDYEIGTQQSLVKLHLCQSLKLN